MSQSGAYHSPGDCHMEPALSSLRFLRQLLQKETETVKLKRKQKVLRSIRVFLSFMYNYCVEWLSFCFSDISLGCTTSEHAQRWDKKWPRSLHNLFWNLNLFPRGTKHEKQDLHFWNDEAHFHPYCKTKTRKSNTWSLIVVVAGEKHRVARRFDSWENTDGNCKR